MPVETVADPARGQWPVSTAQLEGGSYQPGAGRGVRLPKPNGGERRLGIPTVPDRLMQQAVRQGLTPEVDPACSPHSDGYRPGRSAQDAVRAAPAYSQAGHPWTVAGDSSAVVAARDHDSLRRQGSAQVKDKRVLRRIGGYLRAPVHLEGRVEQRTRGPPQGGLRSPRVANSYREALDTERERRGLHCGR